MLDVKPYSNLLVVVVLLLLDHLVVDVEDVWSHGKQITSPFTNIGQIFPPFRQDKSNCTLCCKKRSIMKTFISSHT